MLKKDLIETIVVAYDTHIKPILIKAEIGEFSIKPSENMPKEKLQFAMQWIDVFIKEDVKEFTSVHGLVSEETWKHYKIYGLTDLVEVIMLKDAKKKLKTKWSKRPSCMRRTYGSE